MTNEEMFNSLIKEIGGMEKRLNIKIDDFDKTLNSIIITKGLILQPLNSIEILLSYPHICYY